MIPLIDSDIVAYRVAATVPEQDDFEICQYRIDVLMQNILESCEASEYVNILSGKNNFRKEIYPEYKANRKDMVRPYYLDACKDYLKTAWKSLETTNVEADDMLGWLQTPDTILCSIDKDLKQIPGKHFNFVKLEFDDVDLATGNKFFWKQMLIGDTTDNIKGIAGIGPKKAAKVIDPCESEQECFERVWELYNGDTGHFVINAQCLWIMREENVSWVNHQNLILPNELQQEVDQMSEFMKSLKVTT